MTSKANESETQPPKTQGVGKAKAKAEAKMEAKVAKAAATTTKDTKLGKSASLE